MQIIMVIVRQRVGFRVWVGTIGLDLLWPCYM